MKNKDYVTFELSQLLKKNGFREPCLSHYTATGTVWRCNDEDDFNSESELKVYSRPTMWQVTKWLREVHGLHISISTVIGGRWTYELQDLWQNRIWTESITLAYQKETAIHVLTPTKLHYMME